MKTLIIFLYLTIFNLNGKDFLNEVLVIVNDEPITKLELEENLGFAKKELKSEINSIESEMLRKQVLERLIIKKILLQNAIGSGRTVSDERINSAIELLSKRNNMTLTQFKNELKKNGIDLSKFRSEVKEQILIQQLKEQEVDRKIKITQSEIDNYFTNYDKRMKEKEEFELGHILILVPEDANANQISSKRKIAQSAKEKVTEGTDFYEVSATFSDAQNALDGGNLGWRSLDKLPEIFVSSIKRMRIGDTSEIIKSANGFHILKLFNKRINSQQVIVNQTQAKHILKKTNEITSEEEAVRELNILRNRIISSEETFEEIAKQYSDDVSSSRGGDLGWLSPGDTVSEFQAVMDKMSPGEISDVFKTRFGWHILLVVARRDEDLSTEKRESAARQAILLKKTDIAYQEWIRNLRNRSYVQYLK